MIKQSENYRIIANDFLEQGNIIKAQKFYDKALVLVPNNIKLLYDLGYFYDKYINIDKAFKIYNRILEIDNKEAGAYYAIATI